MRRVVLAYALALVGSAVAALAPAAVTTGAGAALLSQPPLEQTFRIQVRPLAQDLADGVIDFDKAVRDPAQPSRILPAYDGGDHLHFSAAGYRAMAAAVPLSKLKRPFCG